jgi:hypothetical protein
MERETKTHTTPAGKELVMKEWLTAGERRKVQEIMIGNGSVHGTPEMKGDAVFKAQDMLIEVSVVSYDGESKNILSRLLGQKAEEFDFVADLAGKTINPLGVAK